MSTVLHRRGQRLLSVDDFEQAARARLPDCVWEYLRGGTETESSLHDNRAAFARKVFRPHGLRAVADRAAHVQVMGQDWSQPFGIAPTGLAGLLCHDADALLASAAARAGIPFIISGSSSVPMERLARLHPHAWYQAYFPGDCDRIAAILKRLEAASLRTLVVTIDTCVAANRENNIRRDFTLPLRLTPRILLDGMRHPVWCVDVLLRTLRAQGIPRLANLYETIGCYITEDPPQGFRTGRDLLTWKHIEFIRAHWPHRLVLKGVLHPGDAAQAADHGVDGVIVSNHGGRQLDGAIAPLDALPAVRAAAPSQLAVMMDGGIRRGTDVLKACALGADLVFLGRAPLYGVAAAGAAGLQAVLELLADEVLRDMALLGIRNLDELQPDMLLPLGSTP